MAALQKHRTAYDEFSTERIHTMRCIIFPCIIFPAEFRCYLTTCLLGGTWLSRNKSVPQVKAWTTAGYLNTQSRDSRLSGRRYLRERLPRSIFSFSIILLHLLNFDEPNFNVSPAKRNDDTHLPIDIHTPFGCSSA